MQLPTGCEYQVAEIELNVSHEASNTTVIFGPYKHPYERGVIVTLTISNSSIEQDEKYEVIIIVETEGGITSSAPYTFCEYDFMCRYREIAVLGNVPLVEMPARGNVILQVVCTCAVVPSIVLTVLSVKLV